MKAINIKHPWAWWILRGYSTIYVHMLRKLHSFTRETYLFYSSRIFDKKAIIIALDYLTVHQMQETLMVFDQALKERVAVSIRDDPRFGSLLFSADLTNYRRMETEVDKEKALCDCTGLYGYDIENVRQLKQPIPYDMPTRSGLFTVPDELIEYL